MAPRESKLPLPATRVSSRGFAVLYTRYNVRDIIDSRHSAEMRSRRGRCQYLARDLDRVNSEMSTGEEIAGIADRT